MRDDNWQGAAYSDGYSHVYRKRTSKTDWAGVGIGQAFNDSLPYYLRLAAQRLFYKLTRKVLVVVAQLYGSESKPEPRVKPQLGPLYTTYPGTLAAYAAIGLTAFLEFEARVPHKILFTQLASYLDNPAEADGITVDPASYKTVAQTVTRWVQTRLLFEELSRNKSLASVEIYRLFAASQETLRYRSLPEIIRSVILNGDILPDWNEMELHPLSRDLLDVIAHTSTLFFQMLKQTESPELIALGERWIRAVCLSLADFLPPPEEKMTNKAGLLLQAASGKPAYRFEYAGTKALETPRIAPLDGPTPPSLQEPSNTSEQVLSALANTGLSNGDGDEAPVEVASESTAEFKQTIDDFAKAVEGAGGQQHSWEDMRSDVVEGILRSKPFQQGPIEGSPAEGHEVSIRNMDGEEDASGEIFDRAVELSDNLPACEQLVEDSRPLSDALKRSLYPNIQEVPETERFRTGGSLDPARLALADIAPTLYRRYRILEKADRKGRPVLVIACDGSASLDSNQMKMLKLLSAGWLNSTARSEIQVLSALYHSGEVRRGLSGPLVRWVYHPHKTPTTSRSDAVRAVAALPDAGTGIQSDALSLAFIMGEARKLARGDMIYLILITDTAWNCCFRTEKTGSEEVALFFQGAYEDFSSKLHTTLVALGVSGETGFEDLLDKVITVSKAELMDCAAVAHKIGVYVATCIRERNHLITHR